MLFTIKYTGKVLNVILLSDNEEVIGYLQAEQTESLIYTVCLSVVDNIGKGDGQTLYKIAMMWCFENGFYLSASEELNTNSTKLWERLTGLEGIQQHKKELIPSFDVPLSFIPDNHFCFYGYNLPPTIDYYVNKIHCPEVDQMIKQGMKLYYNKINLK